MTKVINHWTITDKFITKNKRKYVWAVCKCGTKRYIQLAHYKTNASRSCGCYHNELLSERNKIHGLSKTREYQIWAGAKTRCYNPNYRYYHRYGGRGIQMCDKWKNDFVQFYSDMGNCPSGYTLERLNNNEDYEPGNCIYATWHKQANNKVNNHKITIDNKIRTLQEWSRISGINRTTIASRLKVGMKPKDAVFLTYKEIYEKRRRRT